MYYNTYILDVSWAVMWDDDRPLYGWHVSCWLSRLSMLASVSGGTSSATRTVQRWLHFLSHQQRCCLLSSHIWSGTVWSISVKGLWWWGCGGVQCALLGPRAIWPLKAGGRNGQGGRGSEIQLISVSDSRIHEQPGYCHSCMGSCNAKHSLHRKGNYYKCTQDTFQDEQIRSLGGAKKVKVSINFISVVIIN